MPLKEGNIMTPVNSWLQQEFLRRKLVSPFGILLLGLISLASAFLVAEDLFLVPLVASGLIIGIITVYICLFKPYYGLYVISVFSIFVFYPNHLIGRDVLPLSPVLEILILFVFLGSYLNRTGVPGTSRVLIKTLISIAIITNTASVLIQAFNPNVKGLEVWMPTVRRWLVYIMVYVMAYRLIDSMQKFRFFAKFWIIAAFVVALYGCYQQWFGYLPMEMNYIMSVPGSYELLFQGGQLRKFSFLSDVVSFGVLAGSMATFTLVIAIYQKNRNRMALMIFMALIMLLGMAYSGTRTTTIILPAGIMLYGFLTIKSKTTVITLFCMTMIGLFLFFAPIYSSPTLNRMRTTFDSKDESMNLRERNRHYIQPYLHAHPLGGGIGTSGLLGAHFYPEHPLADFPTDSGLLRIGLESGWIGLIIWIFFNLAILWQGIYYYFRMKSRECKIFIAALLATLFPIIVTQYSQETIGQIPGAIFFFSALSLMKRLMEFDAGVAVSETASASLQND
ncbi:MAG: O-antigen ligase domain-containing protein [Chitinophagaceae bacterium]|nr:MAG: O-antigen ligase domain-containing protein [Chitinophagaceae bacterium]